jgi:hypothetical protein
MADSWRNIKIGKATALYAPICGKTAETFLRKVREIILLWVHKKTAAFRFEKNTTKNTAQFPRSDILMAQKESIRRFGEGRNGVDSR